MVRSRIPRISDTDAVCARFKHWRQSRQVKTRIATSKTVESSLSLRIERCPKDFWTDFVLNQSKFDYPGGGDVNR